MVAKDDNTEKERQKRSANKLKIKAPRLRLMSRYKKSHNKYTLKLLPDTGYSWRKRAGFFLGTFSVLWLFFEPLAVFGGGIEFFNNLNIGGYVLLMSISAIGVILAELISRKYSVGEITINIIVLITQDGRRINVETSQDMTISRFLELFLEEAPRIVDKEWFLAFNQFFIPRLVLKIGDEFKKMPLDKTFVELNIKNGDLFEIHGSPKVPKPKFG